MPQIIKISLSYKKGNYIRNQKKLLMVKTYNASYLCKKIHSVSILLRFQSELTLKIFSETDKIIWIFRLSWLRYKYTHCYMTKFECRCQDFFFQKAKKIYIVFSLIRFNSNRIKIELRHEELSNKIFILVIFDECIEYSKFWWHSIF